MKQRTVAAEKTTARSKFQRYKADDAKVMRPSSVRESSNMTLLREAWAKVEVDPDKNVDYPYRTAVELVKPIRYTIKDVERFSISMGGFQDEKNFSTKAGFFLSALINMGKGKNYVVHTASMQIHYLGYANTKYLRVKGDAGQMLGWGMKSGKIVVEGDAGSDVGRCMVDGKIVIKGNAGREIGTLQSGGEIHLLKDYETVAWERDTFAKVFHRWKLIAAGEWISRDAKTKEG